MKIGIISMQRVKNNGSFLQAYALYTILRREGHEVEFIDFYNELQAKQAVTDHGLRIKRKLKHVKHLITRKYLDVDRAMENSRLFGKSYEELYSLINCDKTLNMRDGVHYDLVIIGSDEVFNVFQFHENQSAIPWKLYAEGVSASKIITYAASCGQTDIKSIQSIGEGEHVKELLKKFDAFSVRDQNTFEYVNYFTGIKPQCNVDPVLLLDEFPKGRDYKPLPYPYMIVYAYTTRMNGADEKKEITDYAKRNDLKIVCVNCFQAWADVQIVATPFALLQYIQEAECVITDTFHGAVFSIRNQKQFAVIVRESNRNKLTGLLDQFGLMDRIAAHPEQIHSIMKHTIDYAEVNSKVQEERDKGLEYLRRFL